VATRGILRIALAVWFPMAGVGATLEEASPQFGASTAIVWQAPTNHLPSRFWTYKRLPQVFSAAAISNGIVLASFEKKGFPRPSTNEIVLWADHPEGEPRPPDFAILPKYGQLSFSLGDRAPDSPHDIARDEAAVKRALKCAALLGVNPAELAPTNAASAGIYGVSLARQIDGVPFLADTEGLQIQFGKDGKIRGFSLQWPRLERDKNCATASPSEIIRCIRARKTPVYPIDGEPDYFARIKSLAHARKLIITQIKAHYAEGMFGEELPENEPSKHVIPVAELEALADFGTNTVPVRLYAPILSADVKRLLESGATIHKQSGAEGSGKPKAKKRKED
jgi:hypothetical protein